MPEDTPRIKPLSPELALVDPELAERARAQLVDRGSPETARADEPRAPRLPVKAKRRSRGKVTAIVAKDGFRPQTAMIKVIAGQTVAKNWVLIKK